MITIRQFHEDRKKWKEKKFLEKNREMHKETVKDFYILNKEIINNKLKTKMSVLRND